jgi:hypothetical protein
MSGELRIDCGRFWVQAVETYLTRSEVRRTLVLTADASSGQPFHAYSHRLDIKAPKVTDAAVGRRFRVLLVEEPRD